MTDETLSMRVAKAMEITTDSLHPLRNYPPDFEHDPRTIGEMERWLADRLIEFRLIHDAGSGWDEPWCVSGIRGGLADDDPTRHVKVVSWNKTINEALCHLILAVAKGVADE